MYPLAAPIGYLDQGGGKAKIPDPATAPYIRQAFELYATGTYTLHTLRDELLRRGFRRPGGGPLYVSSLSHLLNNPFYAGIIRINKSRQTFRGIHQPLISLALFERVQGALEGKLAPRAAQHDFTYRRLFACAQCGRSLIGERQKGHIYYRCHTKNCPTTSVRENIVEEAILSLFRRIELTPRDVSEAKAYLLQWTADRRQGEDLGAALSLSIANTKSRLNRLTDAFVDGLVEKAVFEERRAGLVVELVRLEEEMAGAHELLKRKQNTVTKTLELAESLCLGYEMALPLQKREILKTVTSNRCLDGKTLAITPRIPFERLANRASFQWGAPTRNIRRTREICHKSKCAWIRTWIDSLFEDDALPLLRS
ncbi:MAG: recombinase family protein [Hyphomonadaceae bacterium]